MYYLYRNTDYKKKGTLQMNILCESRGRTLIVKVNGEIDHYSSNELKNKTDREYKQAKSKNIVFNIYG